MPSVAYPSPPATPIPVRDQHSFPSLPPTLEMGQNLGRSCFLCSCQGTLPSSQPAATLSMWRYHEWSVLHGASGSLGLYPVSKDFQFMVFQLMKSLAKIAWLTCTGKSEFSYKSTYSLCQPSDTQNGLLDVNSQEQ